MKKTLFLSAILATALCSSAFAFNSTTTTIDGTTYNGDVWTWNNFKNGEYLSSTNSKYTNYTTGAVYAGKNAPAPSGVNNFYSVFFDSNATNNVGNTLRFDGAANSISLYTDWTTNVWVGGIITTSGNSGTYTLGREGTTTFKLDGTNAVNMTIDSDFKLLTTTHVYVEKGGTWSVAEGRTLTMQAGQIVQLSEGQAVSLTGAGTLNLQTAAITFGNNSSLSISGTNTLAINQAIKLGSGAILELKEGATLIGDNLVHGAVTMKEQGTGLKLGSTTYTLATGSGSVTRVGEQKIAFGSKSQTIDGWAEGDKSFDIDLLYYRVAQTDSADINTVQQAITASDNPVAGILVDGTLTNITNNAAPTRQIFGNGVVKITGDYGKGTDSNMRDFNGTLHITGASARTLFYTNNSIGSDAVVELGVRGQIVSDKGTFTNKITIADFDESHIDSSLLPTIYANSWTESTINSVFELNGHTLLKQGGGTLNVTTKNAVSSLLGSDVTKDNGTLKVAAGTLRLGSNGQYDFGDNFGTNIEVSGGTLDLRTENRGQQSKTFKGTLTMTGGTLSLFDGGAKFEGDITLRNTVNMNAGYSKNGIELAGLVSGSGKVYMTSNRDDSAQTYTVSHVDNTFAGTYYIGQNSAGSNAKKVITLKAANATALKNATVNLVAGDKAKLLLTTETATIAALNGAEGSIVETNVSATSLSLGAGEFSGVVSGAIALNKTGAGTLTLNGTNTYTGGTTVSAGTLTVANDTALGTGATTVTGGQLLINANVVMNGLTQTGGSVVNNGSLTLKGAVAVMGGHDSEEVAPTAANGFSVITTTANFSDIIGGTVNTSGVTSWALNGHSATYSDDALSYETATDVYYINTSADITNITAGHIGNANGKITTDVKLVGDANTVGMKLTGTQTGDTYTFSGSITGAGNLVIEPTTAAAENLADTYVFSGDISGWKGSNSGSIIATSNTALTFTGNSTEINANIMASGGHITATYNHRKEVTVNGAVNNKPWNDKGAIDLNVTDHTTVAFTGAVKADALTVESGSSVSFGQNASLSSIAGAGSLNLSHNLTVTSDTATIGSLTLNAESSITVETATDAHNGELTVTTLVVEGSSDINADLVVTNGGIISFAKDAVLTMGCSVTIGDTVEVRISGADAEAIRHGSELTIINLGQLAATDVITLGSASIYIDDVEQNDFSLMRVDDADGTSRIVVAPEPATATLSLLALAALAARRKRH